MHKFCLRESSEEWTLHFAGHRQVKMAKATRNPFKSVGILWNPEKPISQTFQNHLILAWEVIRSYQVHPSSSQPYLGLKGFGFGTSFAGLVGLVGFGTPPEPPEPPEGAEAAGAGGAGGASRGALGTPGGALGAGALKNWMEMDGVPWSDSGWYLIWAHWALGPRGTSFKCLVAGKLQLRLFNRPMLNAPCESAKTNKCNIPYYRNMLQLTSNFKPSRCCLKMSGHAHHVQKKTQAHDMWRQNAQPCCPSSSLLLPKNSTGKELRLPILPMDVTMHNQLLPDHSTVR